MRAAHRFAIEIGFALLVVAVYLAVLLRGRLPWF